MRHRAALLSALLVAGCGGQESAPSVEARSLPSGVVARAGAELVTQATVERIATRQSVSAREALNRALSDAVLAQGARHSLSPATVTTIERAAAARRLNESLAEQAARQGPPTTAELDELVRELWVDIDRPPAVRAVHAVVLNKDPARDAAALAVAEKLAEAVHSALDAAEFAKLAKAVPADGFKIVAEDLPFVTADGRAFQARDSTFVAQPGGFDPDFAKAANALETIGQQSPLVKSSFGYHVIRLEQRLPAAGIPAAERPTALASEVMSRRAGRARRELLARLRQGPSIQVERAVDELTARVQKSP